MSTKKKVVKFDEIVAEHQRQITTRVSVGVPDATAEELRELGEEYGLSNGRMIQALIDYFKANH